MKSAEKILAQYFENLNLKYEYERPHGGKKPDFTVFKNGKIEAIFELKEFEMSKEELKRLKERKLNDVPLVGSFDPYAEIREKMNAARNQFKGAKKYPCVLILWRAGGFVDLSPQIILASMFGDLGISFPLGEHDSSKTSYVLGDRGKMINPKDKSFQNRTISAIGVMQIVKVDQIKSGYHQKMGKLARKLQTTDHRSLNTYFAGCKKIEEKLSKQGYDLNKEGISITYIYNPIARKRLPQKFFLGNYDNVYRYSLKTGAFKLTQAWNKNAFI